MRRRILLAGPSCRFDRARGALPTVSNPTEQPTEFELVLNARTAQAIGLDIPAKLRSVADRFIE
jgi:hypothetical protein